MTFNSPTQRHRESAFTLLELLLAASIIAILFALLFISSDKMMQRGRSAACAGNLKQLVTGAVAYAADHNMRLPHASSWPLGRVPKWYVTLEPYLNVPDSKILGREFLKCPSAKMSSEAQKYVSYGINYRYVFFAEALDPNNEAQMKVYCGSMKLTQVPASAFLFGDSGIAGGGNQGVIYSPYWWKFERDTDGDGKVDSNSAIGGGPYNWFSPRHSNMGNMALADGSVRAITPRQWVNNENVIWGPDLQGAGTPP